MNRNDMDTDSEEISAKEILERVEAYKFCIVWLPGGEGEDCGVWFTGMDSESDVLSWLKENKFRFDAEFHPSGEFIAAWQFAESDSDFYLPKYGEVPQLHRNPCGRDWCETRNKV